MFKAVLPLSTEMTSPLGVITPKGMKQEKGREGGSQNWANFFVYGWPLI